MQVRRCVLVNRKDQSASIAASPSTLYVPIDDIERVTLDIDGRGSGLASVGGGNKKLYWQGYSMRSDRSHQRMSVSANPSPATNSPPPQ